MGYGLSCEIMVGMTGRKIVAGSVNGAQGKHEMFDFAMKHNNTSKYRSDSNGICLEWRC